MRQGFVAKHKKINPLPSFGAMSHHFSPPPNSRALEEHPRSHLAGTLARVATMIADDRREPTGCEIRISVRCRSTKRGQMSQMWRIMTFEKSTLLLRLVYFYTMTSNVWTRHDLNGYAILQKERSAKSKRHKKILCRRRTERGCRYRRYIVESTSGFDCILLQVWSWILLCSAYYCI